MVKEFKVGDKVRVVKITKAPDDDSDMCLSNYTHHIGNVYTVEHIREAGALYPIEVVEDTIVWRHEDFELAARKNIVGGTILMAGLEIESKNGLGESRC